jgi:predicted transcriptional regulator
MSFHNPFHNTEADTLAMLLPASQVEVMQILWAQGPLKVREVYDQIAAKRRVAYTTVMTTMSRLADKGLLLRDQRGRGRDIIYSATLNEREFVTRAVQEMLDCVVRDYPSALRQYLDTRREVAAGSPS